MHMHPSWPVPPHPWRQPSSPCSDALCGQQGSLTMSPRSRWGDGARPGASRAHPFGYGHTWGCRDVNAVANVPSAHAVSGAGLHVTRVDVWLSVLALERPLCPFPARYCFAAHDAPSCQTSPHRSSPLSRRTTGHRESHDGQIRFGGQSVHRATCRRRAQVPPLRHHVPATAPHVGQS